MNQLHSLETVVSLSKKEQWPYPKTFMALVDAGVASYIVKVDTYTAEYHGEFGTWQEPAPEGFTPLTIAEQFNSQELINALKTHMAGKTTYVEFLGEIAQAGVAYYEVNMAHRTVTYHGNNSDDFHVEHIPQFS